MKKRLIIAAMALLLVASGCSLLSLKPTSVSAVTSYEVAGWRTDISFDAGDEKYFNFYTEFGRSPWLQEGKLYVWNLAEQKAIYNVRKYDDVDVSVDISAISTLGRLDSGIYLHANNVNGNLNGATAWTVNLERNPDNNTGFLKIHRFNGGKYEGCPAMVSGLKLPMDTINLRVVVKSGMMYAFLNRETVPTLTYEIGQEEGYVGLRNYYAPNCFDNLSIVGEGNEKDSSSSTVINETEKFDTDKLTAGSEQAINDALQAAKNAENQYRLEEAIAALKKALNNAVLKRDAEELALAIDKAESITDGSVYTQNGWKSLCAVLEIGKTVDLTDEEAVSYWTNQLERKLALLVKYGG